MFSQGSQKSKEGNPSKSEKENEKIRASLKKLAQDVAKGTIVTEKDIFLAFGMEYVQPKDRE